MDEPVGLNESKKKTVRWLSRLNKSLKWWKKQKEKPDLDWMSDRVWKTIQMWVEKGDEDAANETYNEASSNAEVAGHVVRQTIGYKNGDTKLYKGGRAKTSDARNDTDIESSEEEDDEEDDEEEETSEEYSQQTDGEEGNNRRVTMPTQEYVDWTREKVYTYGPGSKCIEHGQEIIVFRQEPKNLARKFYGNLQSHQEAYGIALTGNNKDLLYCRHCNNVRSKDDLKTALLQHPELFDRYFPDLNGNGQASWANRLKYIRHFDCQDPGILKGFCTTVQSIKVDVKQQRAVRDADAEGSQKMDVDEEDEEDEEELNFDEEESSSESYQGASDSDEDDLAALEGFAEYLKAETVLFEKKDKLKPLKGCAGNNCPHCEGKDQEKCTGEYILQCTGDKCSACGGNDIENCKGELAPNHKWNDPAGDWNISECEECGSTLAVRGLRSEPLDHCRQMAHKPKCVQNPTGVRDFAVVDAADSKTLGVIEVKGRLQRKQNELTKMLGPPVFIECAKYPKKEYTYTNCGLEIGVKIYKKVEKHDSEEEEEEDEQAHIGEKQCGLCQKWLGESQRTGPFFCSDEFNGQAKPVYFCSQKGMWATASKRKRKTEEAGSNRVPLANPWTCMAQFQGKHRQLYLNREDLERYKEIGGQVLDHSDAELDADHDIVSYKDRLAETGPLEDATIREIKLMMYHDRVARINFYPALTVNTRISCSKDPTCQWDPRCPGNLTPQQFRKQFPTPDDVVINPKAIQSARYKNRRLFDNKLFLAQVELWLEDKRWAINSIDADLTKPTQKRLKQQFNYYLQPREVKAINNAVEVDNPQILADCWNKIYTKMFRYIAQEFGIPAAQKELDRGMRTVEAEYRDHFDEARKIRREQETHRQQSKLMSTNAALNAIAQDRKDKKKPLSKPLSVNHAETAMFWLSRLIAKYISGREGRKLSMVSYKMEQPAKSPFDCPDNEHLSLKNHPKLSKLGANQVYGVLQMLFSSIFGRHGITGMKAWKGNLTSALDRLEDNFEHHLGKKASRKTDPFLQRLVKAVLQDACFEGTKFVVNYYLLDLDAKEPTIRENREVNGKYTIPGLDNIKLGDEAFGDAIAGDDVRVLHICWVRSPWPEHSTGFHMQCFMLDRSPRKDLLQDPTHAVAMLAAYLKFYQNKQHTELVIDEAYYVDKLTSVADTTWKAAAKQLAFVRAKGSPFVEESFLEHLQSLKSRQGAEDVDWEFRMFGFIQTVLKAIESASSAESETSPSKKQSNCSSPSKKQRTESQ